MNGRIQLMKAATNINERMHSNGTLQSVFQVVATFCRALDYGCHALKGDDAPFHMSQDLQDMRDSFEQPSQRMQTTKTGVMPRPN